MDRVLAQAPKAAGRERRFEAKKARRVSEGPVPKEGRLIDRPSVACVCLTKDRPEMLARAVRCFQEQTYENRVLYVLDTSDTPRTESIPYAVVIYGAHSYGGQSVGKLRNSLNRWTESADIIAHWDDDDWSDPNRLTEQVALLLWTGADCVGYHDMLFWDNRGCGDADCAHVRCDQAWLYRAGKPNYALGTSLMYWRRTWETKPFPDIHNGEDTEWQRNLNVKTATSLQAEPRMIASIHGGNTNMAGYRINLTGKCEEFKRAPELDDVCRERMSL